MGFLEFILFPVYIAVYYFLFIARKHDDDPILKYYCKQGYWIKCFAVLAFTLFNAILSPGDSFGLYYTEGANIYRLILGDSSHIKWLYLSGPEFDQTLLRNYLNQGYFRAENNYMVARFVAFLSFVGLGKYLLVNFFFAMIAYSGVWRLYRFFYEQYPHLYKQFAIAILYLPTFVFWSSGILKDPLCIASIGWITYAMYESFYKKKDLVKNGIILLVFGYILAVLKIYILISYVPFLVLYLILINVNLVKNKALKWILGPALIIGSVLAGQRVMNQFDDELGTFAGGESSFSLGVDFDGSIISLLKMAPAAIIATFYRPFIWESRKLSTLLSSFESMAIMFFTLFVLYKSGPKQFLLSIRKDPVILYCILFALLFGLFVGATTPNFGSLVRYKIPCMPFYVIALFMINERTKALKKNPADSGAD
jgi:hypothetical protein